MIGAVMHLLDNFTGRGEAAVTVPPLDGAMRPNRRLDEAAVRLPLESVDCLAVVDGILFASAGPALYRLQEARDWKREFAGDLPISALAANGMGGLSIATADGSVSIRGGALDGKRFEAGPDLSCITAMAASGSDLFITNGSTANGPDDWQLDLLGRNATGSVWRIDMASGTRTRVADGLAYPAGLVVDGTTLVCSEAWKHRLVRLDPAKPNTVTPLYTDLAGYPGRLSPCWDGYWLAVFAPRSQLVEFVLREPEYRQRMVRDIPRPYWIAPKLRSGRSFHEPLQGGGVKQLGVLKPWAPTMSAGLCVKLDRAFQPVSSLHSRADGNTHGVTCVAEFDGSIHVAARGDDVVAVLPIEASDLHGGDAA